MTILSAQSIIRRCLDLGGAARTRALISPFYGTRTVHSTGNSFGLSSAGYDIRVADEVRIPLNGFQLVSSVEYFDMPHDLIATVKDKSSLARRGLAVQNTIIEPGWRGYLVLELTAHRDAIFLPAGAPIAQLVFELLDEPTSMPYSGKYQNQRRGQDAIFEQPTEEPR